MVEIVKGKKIEKNLCDEHAVEEGLVVKAAHTPINELLTNFVKIHSGSSETHEIVCNDCGLSFADFRESSLLGCPNCYKMFEEPLGSLLERAHEGATNHIGKVPCRAGAAEQRQVQVLRMRKQLEEAVAGEDYERAAGLRDSIREIEESQ